MNTARACTNNSVTVDVKKNQPRQRGVLDDFTQREQPINLRSFFNEDDESPKTGFAPGIYSGHAVEAESPLEAMFAHVLIQPIISWPRD